MDYPYLGYPYLGNQDMDRSSLITGVVANVIFIY